MELVSACLAPGKVPRSGLQIPLKQGHFPISSAQSLDNLHCLESHFKEGARAQCDKTAWQELALSAANHVQALVSHMVL